MAGVEVGAFYCPQKTPRNYATEIGSRDVSAATLLQASVRAVIKNIPSYIDEVERLPVNLKDRILLLMSKRGLITDENIAKVLHPQVRALDLSECEISDSGLQELRICRQLRKLDLNAMKQPRTDVTSQGVISISQTCPNLEVLYFRRCATITDEALIALSRSCRRIRDLNLGGCPAITDLSLEAMGSNLSFLRSINLSGANISDGGINSLVSGCCASSLKEIHMNNCTRITDEAVESVINFCPQIRILLFHGCPSVTEQARLALEELTLNHEVTQVSWTVY